jgi:hypothetical protein
MENCDEYGKVFLSKGTILYHWSYQLLTDLSDNLFLCLDNSFWNDTNKIMHKYKLKKDIELILTIQNDNIINKQSYSNKNKRQDYEILTTIYNNIINPNSYSRDGDVMLKTNKKKFSKFCNKLGEHNYKGLFNYIDGEKGQFEIVIFKPSDYLELIETNNYDNIELHNLKDSKRIMLNKKINYIYSYNFNYEDIDKIEDDEYPSIFYYIYKKIKLI